jgi:superfamily II DNA or RNA helicase
MLSIGPKGFSIPKASLSPKVLDALRAELTVKPINMMDEYLANSKRNMPDTSFPVYHETCDEILVPKAYGLSHFGVAQHIDLPDGTDIDVRFEGELRPTQMEPTQAFMDALADPKRMGGIINLACAGGKTVIALNIISRLQKKAMIVCHKEFLISQWKERIAEFLPTARVGIIKAKECDVVDKDIVIASLQSLSMKQYERSTFKEFAIAVYDECHHTSAAVFSRVFATVGTRYTLGLSATLNRKDGLTKVFKWHIGDVVHHVQPPRPKSGGKSELRVISIPFQDTCPSYCRVPTIFGGQKPNTSRMINNICEFQPRTMFLVECVRDTLIAEPGRKILVLSDRRGHLEEIQRRLTAVGVDAGLYYGGLKQSVLSESEKKTVMLGTFAYVSEGFDNKDLNTIVLGSPKSDIVQVVGRILRTPPEERRHVPLVLDIVDKFSVFTNQARSRVRYYNSQGYMVSNVSGGDLTKAVQMMQEKPIACLIEDDPDEIL